MTDTQPTPTLFFDRRAESSGPGFHALVIGVSAYKFLPAKNKAKGPPTYGLETLEGPAASAFRIAEALKARADDLTPPLRTLRLLISPCDHELEHVEGLRDALGRSQPATTENVVEALLDWQGDVERDQDGRSKTFFYFSGHGLGYAGSQTALLCEDFAARGGDLDRAVDRANIVNGMLLGTSPSAQTAESQFFFFDCCRDTPDALARRSARPREAFTLRAGGPRAPSPVQSQFPASAAGERAKAIPSGDPNPRTVFGAALREALLRGGEPYREQGQKVWRLTAGTLHAGMMAFAQVDPVLAEFVRDWRPEGYSPPGPALLKVSLDRAPLVELYFQFDPDGDHDIAWVEFGQYNTPDHQLTRVGAPVPRGKAADVPAGTYRVRVSNPAGAPPVDYGDTVKVANLVTQVLIPPG